MIELHFSFSRIFIKVVKLSVFDNQNNRISLFLNMLAKKERNRFLLYFIFETKQSLNEKEIYSHYEFY